jgi:hypothetical protein
MVGSTTRRAECLGLGATSWSCIVMAEGRRHRNSAGVRLSEAASRVKMAGEFVGALDEVQSRHRRYYPCLRELWTFLLP